MFSPHHIGQHLAHHGSCLRRACTPIAEIWRLQHGVDRPAQLLDKTRTHKHSIVGYSIVESERIERRYLGGIAVTLPRQGYAPSAVAWHRIDARHHLPGNTGVERFEKTDFLYAWIKTSGIGVITRCYDPCHTYIGGLFYHIAHTYTSGMMRVSDRSSAGICPSVTGREHPVKTSKLVDDTVLDSYHHWKGLDHRTRLITHHGTVACLDIAWTIGV